jgi:hypothetical protein
MPYRSTASADATKFALSIYYHILVKSQKHKDAMDPYIEKLALLCLDRYGNVLSPYVLTEKVMKQKKNQNLISDILSGIQLYPPEK